MTAYEKLEKMGLVQEYEGFMYNGTLYAMNHDEEDNYVKLSEEEYITGDIPEDAPEMTAEEVLEDIIREIKKQLAENKELSFKDYTMVCNLLDIAEQR